MIWIAIFFAAQAISSVLAIHWGGQPERLIAIALAVAMLLGIAVPYSPQTYDGVAWPILTIDVALFTTVAAIAFFADRYWPQWAAGGLFLTITIHGAKAYDRDVLPYAYWLVTGKAGYLTLILLVAGAWRHHDRRRQHVLQYDWTRARKAATVRHVAAA